jgi:hypothetical protein
MSFRETFERNKDRRYMKRWWARIKRQKTTVEEHSAVCPRAGWTKMVRLTLEQLRGSKRGLRGTLLGQAVGESASRRSEPKTFPFLSSRTNCRKKHPRMGGRREEIENPVRTMPWLL